MTYFHLKMKIGCIYETLWPSYISRMMDEMHMSKVIIKKIILSNSAKLYHISAVTKFPNKVLSMRCKTAMIIKIAVFWFLVACN